MISLKQEINQLKQEKNAVILAHYYVPDDVQEIADYIGDSFYLSKIAKNIQTDLVVFAGVSFMGESAKILNPQKKILLPDEHADCAMAHMATVEKIKEMREKYTDLAVVCYINSTAELKTMSDVCVTSSNAVKIVKKLPNKNIFFIPDENLGTYVAKQVPEKNIICNAGYCPVHKQINVELVQKTKKEHKNALFVAHPECTKEVLALADFVGSTSEIIDFVTNTENEEFIIGTENGVMYELMKQNPNKKFYPAMPKQYCEDMKKVTLEKVRDALLYEQHEVHVDKQIGDLAIKALDKMLELAK